MGKYKRIHILSSPADREQLSPILEALGAKGLRAAEGQPGKNDLVLAVLSENLYADETLTDRLLGLLAAGAENVLPLRLDAVKVPEALMNALYARNIIPAGERDAALLAERIVAALPKKKSRLPLALIAGAVVLAALAGVLIWRSVRNRETVPAMEETPPAAELVLPEGITAEELEDVVLAYYVGDRFYHYSAEDLANGFEYDDYHVMEDDGMHWYSKSDGHEFTMASYDPKELEFIRLMPNLELFELVLVDCPSLPDLSGLENLWGVEVIDSTVTDIGGLANSGMEFFGVFRSPIGNYSVLSSCENLNEFVVEFHRVEKADFSGFAPPALESAEFRYGGHLTEMDLSALAECGALRHLRLYQVPVESIGFLNGQPVEELELDDLPRLRDLSPIGTLSKLRQLTLRDLHDVSEISFRGLSSLETLTMEFCEGISDISSLSECRELIGITTLGMRGITDASALAGLPRLTEVSFMATPLRNMDFLEGLADNGPIRTNITPVIGDYAGLAYVKEFSSIIIAMDGRSVAPVLPYLEGASVGQLWLTGCSDVELSRLPEVTESLRLDDCDLTDLSALPPWSITNLTLEDLQYLTSLDGIENLPAFRRGGELILDVYGCPRLRDWSAVENASLAHLGLTGVYSLPVFDGIGFGSLRLESIEGLDDLQILDSLSDGHAYDSIELIGLDGLRDLSPLRRLHIAHLDIPPQLAEQGQEFVDDGVVEEFTVTYPDGSWQPYEEEIKLLSLEELDTLPKSLLRRVTRLCLAGDTPVDTDGADLWEQWDHGADMPVLLLHPRGEGDSVPIDYEEGTLSDLTALRELTGLRELRLYAQHLESLDGVQSLSALERLTVSGCPALTDAAAVFAVPTLRYLALNGCPVESIRGVQNLSELEELDICGTAVTDLTPLTELESLQVVRISPDMKAAAASLDGLDVPFELDIG